MSTLFFIGKKILHAFLLLLAVILLNFTLLHLAPGDIAQVIAGEMGGITEELLADIRAKYSLDKSFIEQASMYVWNIIRLDFGHSYYYNLPVLDLIMERVPATLLLVSTALLMAVILGTILGVIAARKKDGIFNYFVTLISVSGYSTPVFWLGMILLVIFAYLIPVFPTGGMYDPSAEMTTLEYMWNVLHHLLLPAFTLGFIYVASYSLISRASMLEILSSDYIRTARAKGLSENKVMFKHALRNAVMPVVTLAGLQFSQVFAGAILVETVFNWPGLGKLSLEAIISRDYPTVLGILFFSALIVILVNILTDICYRLIDPRIAS